MDSEDKFTLSFMALLLGSLILALPAGGFCEWVTSTPQSECRDAYGDHGISQVSEGFCECRD